MLKILIADDEKESVETTRRVLELLGDVEIVGEVNSGLDAMEFVKNNPVDLVLLDIEMPGDNGFDTANYLHKNYPEIKYVFLTGHTDFALTGYDYAPLSFLVKPVSVSKLESVLNLLREQTGTDSKYSYMHKKIGIHSASRLEIVDVSDVIYMENVGRKVKVFCKNGRVIDSTENLKKLYDVFSDYGFYRCHQSFAVQVGEIESIGQDIFKRAYVIKLKGLDTEIPLSRDNYGELKNILKKRGISIV